MKLSRVCWLLILFKVVYLACVAAALLIWPMSNEGTFFHSATQQWTPDGHLNFESHFVSWDAEHYLHLAVQGYQTGQSQCAFYPLFPLTIRCLSILTGDNVVIAGMILANVFSLAGEILLFVVVRKRFGERVAQSSLVLHLAFPGSLFFQFIYSEGLFFFLLMLLVYSLEHDRPIAGIVAAFLLPLTRAVGIFSIVPIFWHLFIKNPPDWLANEASRTWLSRKIFALETPSKLHRSAVEAIVIKRQMDDYRYWILLGPLYGWGVYLFQMWAWTGNPFEGFEAQKQWGAQSLTKLFAPIHFIGALFTPANFHEFYGSTVDRCCFMLLTYTLIILWRTDKGWFLWAVCLGVVPAITGTFVSFTRFASVIFPLFVVWSVPLSRPRPASKCLRLLSVLVFSLFHVILVWRFLNYRWAG